MIDATRAERMSSRRYPYEDPSIPVAKITLLKVWTGPSVGQAPAPRC